MVGPAAGRHEAAEPLLDARGEDRRVLDDGDGLVSRPARSSAIVWTLGWSLSPVAVTLWCQGSSPVRIVETDGRVYEAEA